jgi:hypothetical protein
VFRYALERWDLAPYEVVVFHRGDLTAEQRTLVGRWEYPNTNATVKWVNLAEPANADAKQLWHKHGRPEALPWVVVRSAEPGTSMPPVYAGPPDEASLRRVFDSPARRRIVETATEGNSATFILLLSGDPALDEAAAKLVDRELAQLTKRIRLPEQRDDGPRIRLALPLKASFTVVQVRRDDPEEATFVRVLLGTDSDLADIRGPVLFPVFGRGRVLGHLHGNDLNADGVFEVVNFLCGACSCEAKELNPGADLLIAANWNDLFARIGDVGEEPKAPPPAAQKGTPAAPRVTMVETRPSAAPPAAERTSEPRTWLLVAVIVAAGSVVVTGAWAFSQLRAKPETADPTP